jgi:hypothetical protein
MSDITMCAGKNCERRLKCHRFTAPVNPYRQSYSDFDVREDGVECERFWDNKGYGESKEREQ